MIQHDTFNRSATFHLETKLINYFLGDEKYTLQNKSKTVNDVTHNYYNKAYYDQQLFKGIWHKLYEEKPETIHETGSIYTIQGFDLNYVGVILGPSVQYEPTKNQLIIDKGAYTGAKDLINVEEAKEKIILNSINILMKRGIKGLYIYASDEALRKKLLSY